MPSYVWIMDGLMLAYVYVIMGHCLACLCDYGLCFMKTNGVSICTSVDRMHHVYLAYGFKTLNQPCGLLGCHIVSTHDAHYVCTKIALGESLLVGQVKGLGLALAASCY